MAFDEKEKRYVAIKVLTGYATNLSKRGLTWELTAAMTRTYLVSDFGSAQPSQLHTYDEITAPTLRAPEIILQGAWDEKVDIWAFGCLIFELVTGSALFVHKPYPKYALDETTAHLWQMLCFTRERITRQQVEASKLVAQYFNLTVNPDDVDNPFCDLKADPRIYNSPFAALLERYNILERQDVLATASITEVFAFKFGRPSNGAGVAPG